MNGVDRDYSTTSYSDQDAVEKASQLDRYFRFGTKIFPDTQQRRIYYVFCYIQRNLCR